jgi:alkylation response protein AidB-like acyl-CoA dehydrogenase
VIDLRPTTLDARSESLRQEVRSFIAEQRPSYRPGLGMAADYSPEFSRALAARGWLGMTIPREYGGNESSVLDRLVVTEELLAAGAPVAAHWVADRQSAPMIVRCGTEEQKRRFLPGIARGEIFFSIGMSEPDAGSDLASVRTAATRAEGGWEVHGTKIWTTYAHKNDYFVILCRTSPRGEDKHAGLSQLIVDLRADGVKVNPLVLLNGSHSFNEVVLDGAFVSDEMVLGEVGMGWTQVTSELAHERAGPDRYLSTFAVLRQLLAERHHDPATEELTEAIGYLTTRYWMLRQLSLSVARLLDEGKAPAVEAALLKDLGTVFEQEVVETLHRVLDEDVDPGAEGLFESLLADATLMAPSFTIRGGTTEVLRIVTARSLRA